MAQRKFMALAAAAVVAVLSVVAGSAEGGSRFVTEPADAEQSRAYRYAALGREECLAALKKREVRSFNLLLTPNHDWGHRDHLHMEVRSGIKWFLIH